MWNIKDTNVSIETISSNALVTKSKTASITTSQESRRLLKEGYQPSAADCICSRVKAAKSHTGNIRFLQLVEENSQKYADATSKLEKSLIVSTIIDAIRDASSAGGFVKEEGGRWYELGEHLTRENVGRHLRNKLSSRYSSSSAAKKRRRRRADEASMITKLDDMVVRRDGTGLADRVEKLTRSAAQSHSGSDVSDDELQHIFNQANRELLQRMKDQNMFSNDDFATSVEGGTGKPTNDDSSVDSSESKQSKRKFDCDEDDFENFELLEIDENDTAFDLIPIQFCCV